LVSLFLKVTLYVVALVVLGESNFTIDAVWYVDAANVYIILVVLPISVLVLTILTLNAERVEEAFPNDCKFTTHKILLEVAAGVIARLKPVSVKEVEVVSTVVVISWCWTCKTLPVGIAAGKAVIADIVLLFGLIIGSVQIQENKSGTTNTLYWSTRIYAGSSKIFESPNGGAESVNNNTGEFGLRTTIQFLHSPNSTSQITYTLKGKNDDGAATAMVINRNGSPASITLMEIAG